jgi:SAM-dependent methyltransferase
VPQRLSGRGPRLCVRGAALEAGSDAHYVDPAYYDITYANRAEDVAYYVGLAAALPVKRRRVLEYGCGNGRILLELARCGADATGVDRSPTMLGDLRRRLRGLPALAPRVHVRRGDMRSLRVGARFPLVFCTFNTFLHLYTRQDVERFCARVREHLEPRGRFVVDVSMPDAAELARKPERAYRVRPFRHPSGEMVRYAERFDYDPLSQVLTVAMEFEPVARSRTDKSWMTPLAHRQFFPQELEALLHYNGLPVVDIHGSFAHEPPAADSEMLIYHCKRG